MRLMQEIENAFYERMHFGEGQHYLVCSPAFERELADEIEEREYIVRAYTRNPTDGPQKVALVTQFCGNPVLISSQVERYKILTEMKVRPLPNVRTM